MGAKHRRSQETFDGKSDPVAGSPSTPVAAFEVRSTRLLDENANVLAPLPEFARSRERLIALYGAMVRARVFDTKAVALQRTGQLGTYAPCLGQEAVAVAVGDAMRPEDVLLPTYREVGAQLLRGVRMSEIYLYWGGDERGMDYRDAPRHDFPLCVPIATHAPHAVGVAYALALRKEPRVAVCFLGDGATSKGDFYEAINLAGAWSLPVVFVVVDNRWAISVPRQSQTAAATLAQKAIAAGIPGEQVDGNDVIAMRWVFERALEAARSGRGPALVEALTYRLGDHTTADDASRYRQEKEVEAARRLDPVARLRAHLTQQGWWATADQEALDAAAAADVEEAVKEYLATPPRSPESMFDHLYETLPRMLEPEREAVRRRGRGDG